MASPAEAQEFPGRARVVEQVCGHHKIHTFSRLEGGNVRTHIPAAERLSPFTVLGKLDHAFGHVDPRDLCSTRLPEQARVETVPAGKVQHGSAADIAE